MTESGTNIWVGAFTLSAANGAVSFSVSAPSGVTVSQASGTVRPGTPVTISLRFVADLTFTFPKSLTVNNITVGLDFSF